MKIAVVKSSVYQDLWVTDICNNPYDLFKSSMMRCPAIGLAEEYGADFIIVKDTDEYPCGSNKNCLDARFTDSMKFAKEGKNPGLPFLDETFHKEVTIDSVAYPVDLIEWSKYDIVMCVNACIPARITQKYPRTMWCYWIGENNTHLVMNKLNCYDLVLNQDVFKQDLPSFSIGFPYTYIGPLTIETIVKHHYKLDSIIKGGIFMEINNTQERPVQRIPNEFQLISTEIGQAIIKHSQNILENAKNLVEAKYYVKLLGRKIRGNGILECISAGTLILARETLVEYNDLLLPECKIQSYTDAIVKIKFFDANPLAYKAAIQAQRDLLNTKYFRGPYDALLQKYNTLKA
jgi:hypothetical protein